MDQNRKSKMEQAEGSRDSALENRRMNESRERMRNRDSSGDLGSSSDRAMMEGRSAEARSNPSDSGSSSSSSMSSERGMGSSGERNSSSSEGRSSRSGSGISNRDLDREQCEQDRVPERGRSQSDR